MSTRRDDKPQAVVCQLDVDTQAPASPLSAGLKQCHITMISIAAIIGAGPFIGSAAGVWGP